MLWSAAGLEAHTIEFDQPPAVPALDSIAVELTIADGAGQYIARKAVVRLPRDPDPANAGQTGSLFHPIDVTLYRAPNAPVSPGWAVIRAHVRNIATSAPLEGAFLRVIRVSDSKVLARGMSDDRGEALIVVSGIPITTFSAADGGSPLATEIDVKVEVIFDPAAGKIPDPDAVEANGGLPTASSTHKLAAGRELFTDLAINVP